MKKVLTIIVAIILVILIIWLLLMVFRSGFNLANKTDVGSGTSFQELIRDNTALARVSVANARQGIQSISTPDNPMNWQ